jgi:ABC-type nitrate/sulfonate/bicarbonate transport system substrate-binding protein
MVRRVALAAMALVTLLVFAGARGGAQTATLAPVRLGYQTNIWGMPLLVAIQSGAFAKYNVPIKEIQVTSGNKTRDLMVGGQADMGTFAAPAFIIGADKGELQAIGVVAYVPRTLSLMAKPTIARVQDLRGKKIGMQPGASSAILAVTKILPSFGLAQGDYQAVNVDVSNMVQALAQGSIDGFIGVEPYNAIAVAQGIGKRLLDYGKYDLLPVFLNVRPEFAREHPESVTAIMQGMLATRDFFKQDPAKAINLIYGFYTGQGLRIDKNVVVDAVTRLDVNVGFKPGLREYLQETAEAQLKAGQIKAIPDWNKALVPGFLVQAEKTYKR